MPVAMTSPDFQPRRACLLMRHRPYQILPTLNITKDRAAAASLTASYRWHYGPPEISQPTQPACQPPYARKRRRGDFRAQPSTVLAPQRASRIQCASPPPCLQVYMSLGHGARPRWPKPAPHHSLDILRAFCTPPSFREVTASVSHGDHSGGSA